MFSACEVGYNVPMKFPVTSDDPRISEIGLHTPYWPIRKGNSTLLS